MTMMALEARVPRNTVCACPASGDCRSTLAFFVPGERFRTTPYFIGTDAQQFGQKSFKNRYSPAG